MEEAGTKSKSAYVRKMLCDGVINKCFNIIKDKKP